MDWGHDLPSYCKLPEVRDLCLVFIRLQAKELLQADASWLHLISVSKAELLWHLQGQLVFLQVHGCRYAHVFSMWCRSCWEVVDDCFRLPSGSVWVHLHPAHQCPIWPRKPRAVAFENQGYSAIQTGPWHRKLLLFNRRLGWFLCISCGNPKPIGFWVATSPDSKVISKETENILGDFLALHVSSQSNRECSAA